MITRAKPASSSELPSAFMTVGDDRYVEDRDSPQWPVTKSPAQLA